VSATTVLTDRVPLFETEPPAFVQEQDFAARQYRGRRDNQEDYYAFADAAESEERSLERLLLVVGDGLGAHAGGSVASYIGVNAFVRAFHEQDGPVAWKLKHAVETANETLGFITSRMPSVAPPMGTTMVGALITPKTLQWISVGDSPLFLFREGALIRLNADHSLSPLIDARADRGEITPAASSSGMARGCGTPSPSDRARASISRSLWAGLRSMLPFVITKIATATALRMLLRAASSPVIASAKAVTRPTASPGSRSATRSRSAATAALTCRGVN
jgi:hypothetical protein